MEKFIIFFFRDVSHIAIIEGLRLFRIFLETVMIRDGKKKFMRIFAVFSVAKPKKPKIF